MEVKGYKVFNSNWICRDKQYTCPGIFEEKDIELSLCVRGMHFCKNLIDCFNYYDFNPKNKVAEVIAHGDVIENLNKCCTNKLEIVREISWFEVLEKVNVGKDCTGMGNVGNGNSGRRNVGNYNSGDCNVESYNSGNCNVGRYNSGNYNVGNYNSGGYNIFNYNLGSHNIGSFNIGSYNMGACNIGFDNQGSYNDGNHNKGDYNKASYSNGCFNTTKSLIYMFNKLTNWTMVDWNRSDARAILAKMPSTLNYISYDEMLDEEKREYPEAKITGGYLKISSKEKLAPKRTKWWNELSEEEKQTVMSLPNFDKEIFKETTGIQIED